jgi:hypothetical protein
MKKYKVKINWKYLIVGVVALIIAFIPDPVPVYDEAFLGLVAILFGILSIKDLIYDSFKEKLGVK